MYRTSPQDKLMLVAGLKAVGSKIAVTAEGVSDSGAL
jgi:magnesium-transporting ATPase (P-type)